MLAIWSPIAGADSAVSTPGSLFAGAIPNSPADQSTDAVELGVRFTASVHGWVTGVSYYRMAGQRAAPQGTVWNAAGGVLARAAFPTTTDTSGWTTALLTDPVELSPGAKYVVSYTAPSGHYADDQYAFSGQHPLTRGNLTAIAGVYNEQLKFPDQTWNDSNYYADPIFTTVDPEAAGTPSPSTTRVTATTPSTRPTTTTQSTTSSPIATTKSSSPATSTVSSTTATSTTAATSGNKPGASNTGVPDGRALTPSGSLTLRTPNQVVDGLDINGSVDVQASGVVIRNSRIHGSGSFGVLVRSGSVTISDSELYGFDNGIAGDDWSGYRLDIHGMNDDGVKLGSRVTLADSWIHDLTPSAGAHADGGQMQSGVVNLTVRHNVIDMSTADQANSALFLAPDLGPSTNGPVTISSNWLDGGNFTIFCVDGNNGEYFVNNISIVSNRFGQHSSYGPARVNVPIFQSLNVWDSTGISLTL